MSAGLGVPSSPGQQASAVLAEAARLRAQGRMAEALAPARRAAQLLPTNPAVLYDLGLTCLELGQHKEAIGAFEQALALRPRYAEAAWQLGVARYAAGDFEGALADFRSAVAVKPSLAEARFWLATLLQNRGLTDEAIAAFQKTRSVAGKTGLGWVAEARACWLRGDDAGVELAGRRATLVDPRNADGHAILGGVHADAGRFDEAARSFERALELNPRLIRLWYDLVRCRRMTDADRPLVARMQAAARQPGPEPGSLAMLLLAIGKAFDDLGEYGEAMRAFDAAAEVRASRQTFDPALWRRRIEAMIARFSPQALSAATTWGSPDETPVFVLGMPRSGTTLVEQMLSNHPDVVGAGELNFWAQRVVRLEGAGGETLDAPFVAQAAADYLAHMRPLGPTARRIIDKSPFNVIWAGLIHMAFPRATIIHCRRRPIDTALSIHQT